MIMEDGTGTGNKQRVDAKNRSHAYSVVVTEDKDATKDGDSYNINTGIVSMSGSGDNALLYLKNDEVRDLSIDLIVIGVGTIGGSPTDTLLVTVVEGPTAGDIISDASPVRMKKNRNFGSAKTLSSTTLVYKGKDGGTMTGGNDALLVNVTTPRTAVPIDIDLPRGASIGIFIDMKSATATNVYAAIVTHIKSDIA